MPPKRDKKDPLKPKGRMSAYAFYVQHMRAEQKSKGIDVQFKEFSLDCSQGWKELQEKCDAKGNKPKELQRFFDLAEEDRVRYEREMADYVPPPGEKGKKGRKKKDPNLPKRPKSAFFCFADVKREKLRQEDPGATVGEIAKKLGAAWKVMSDEQKEPYQEKAKEERERYETQMAEYRKKLSSKGAEVDDEEEDEYSDED